MAEKLIKHTAGNDASDKKKYEEYRRKEAAKVEDYLKLIASYGDIYSLDEKRFEEYRRLEAAKIQEFIKYIPRNEDIDPDDDENNNEYYRKERERHLAIKDFFNKGFIEKFVDYWPRHLADATLFDFLIRDHRKDEKRRSSSILIMLENYFSDKYYWEFEYKKVSELIIETEDKWVSIFHLYLDSLFFVLNEKERVHVIRFAECIVAIVFEHVSLKRLSYKQYQEHKRKFIMD